MKGKMDLFCASPASTAICTSMESRAVVRGAQRPKESHSSKPYAPCSSHLPIIPQPYSYEKVRRSSAKMADFRRKSSADIDALRKPSGSARFLLSDKPFIDWLSDQSSDHRLSSSILVPAAAHQSAKSSSSTDNKNIVNFISSKNIENYSRHSKPPVSSTKSRDQVVVLRVSIHCKGCEGKVRRHISKMEGVTSFSIDLATKKVTVIGNVTPSGVLESISKVKKAQLWPSSTLPRPTPPPSAPPRPLPLPLPSSHVVND